MIAGFAYAMMGALLTWAGWRSWRHRNAEAISVVEATILRVTGEEALPKTPFDRFLSIAQAALGFLLGPFFFVLGIVVISAETGLL